MAIVRIVELIFFRDWDLEIKFTRLWATTHVSNDFNFLIQFKVLLVFLGHHKQASNVRSVEEEKIGKIFASDWKSRFSFFSFVFCQYGWKWHMFLLLLLFSMQWCRCGVDIIEQWLPSVRGWIFKMNDLDKNDLFTNDSKLQKKRRGFKLCWRNYFRDLFTWIKVWKQKSITLHCYNSTNTNLFNI